MMSSCYPAPFQDDVRWVHSIPQARSPPSFPALCRAHCQVTDNYFTWYLSTCRHIRILYLQNCLFSTILCRLSFQPVWKERMEWKGDNKLSLKLLLSELRWEGLQKDILHSWSPGLQKGCSEIAEHQAEHQGRQVAREQELQSLCISSAAVEEVEPLWNPQSSSQGTVSSLKDMLHGLY